MLLGCDAVYVDKSSRDQLPIDKASQLTLVKFLNIPTAYTLCLHSRKAVHLPGRSLSYSKLSDERAQELNLIKSRPTGPTAMTCHSVYISSRHPYGCGQNCTVSVHSTAAVPYPRHALGPSRYGYCLTLLSGLNYNGKVPISFG
jgi:hypothetical protein